jgi:hypothetical protein
MIFLKLLLLQPSLAYTECSLRGRVLISMQGMASSLIFQLYQIVAATTQYIVKLAIKILINIRDMLIYKTTQV